MSISPDILKIPDPALIERRIIEWCQRHDNVRAAILTSTRAVPGARVDKFSDTDVILVVTDIMPMYENRQWLSDFGDVLVVCRDPIGLQLGLERCRFITQYADASKIDFTLWPVDLLRRVAQAAQLEDELDVGYRILIDKDHLADSLPKPTYRAHIPTHPSHERFVTLVEEFFHEATYVAKHLWRGELLPTKFQLNGMKQFNLRQILEWRIELDHDWNLKLGASGKGLKKHISAERWSELERTYVGAAPEDNWNALYDTIVLFREVATEVAERLHYAYPQELDSRVVAYLRKVQKDSQERQNSVTPQQ
jgi:aminoglycoside 6-adenylyltransferase